MIIKSIEKSLDGTPLGNEEIAGLFEAPLFSKEAALIQTAARKKSEQASNGLAEVHAQIGLNIAPCIRNCQFCAFAECNGVFSEKTELPPDEVLHRAKQFETDGANAVYLMSTAHYPFGKFVEIGQEVRRSLEDETVLVANVGDFDDQRAKRLQAAGFNGVYHAVRMGEGHVTEIPVEDRLRTFEVAREAGLVLGTCVEPVGPEHQVAELVEKTIITRDAMPSYSGSARRIPIPGTDLGKLGEVSEARMAHILAVVRLALGTSIPGNCTHEPNVIGTAAGANLLWAEAGSNPRDTEENTEDQRGMTVTECRKVFEEAEWEVLDGPSRFHQSAQI